MDSRSALESLAHACEAVRVAVSFQNGVEKDEELARWCGEDRVVGAMCVVGGTLEEPGLVSYTLPGVSFLGELPRGTSPRVERLGELFRGAGLGVEVTDRILSAEWSKLVHSVPVMSVAALTGLPLHRLLGDPDLAAVYVRLVREAGAVAAAVGVELDDWPLIMPLKTIAGLSDADAIALIRERGREFEERGNTAVHISMRQSIESRRRLEVEAVQGYVAREAARHGLEVPVLDACYRMLKGIDSSFA
jgi:2-dehydropantoate 2-reductase